MEFIFSLLAIAGLILGVLLVRSSIVIISDKKAVITYYSTSKIQIRGSIAVLYGLALLLAAIVMFCFSYITLFR